MLHNIHLSDQYISLVPLSPADSENYRQLRNRPDNNACFFTSGIISSEQQCIWYSDYLSDESQVMFGIYENDPCRFLGAIALVDIDHANETAEVGRIIVDRNLAAGRHYGERAILLVSNFAQDKLELQTLYAFIYSENVSSIKSFMRAGFKSVDENEGIVKYVRELGE